MADIDNFDHERRVIEKRFAAQWGSTTKIRWENQPWSEPKADQTWVALTIVTAGEGAQIDLRDKALHRYGGSVIIQVFQKENTGTGAANILVGRAAAIFRRAEICEDDSGLIRFRTPAKTVVGANNGWYQINVSCPYFRDVHHDRPTT